MGRRRRDSDGPGAVFMRRQRGTDAFFEKQNRPLLAENCTNVQRASEKTEGGLLPIPHGCWSKVGDTGPAIAPGDPDASLLIQAVRHTDKDLAMPPKKKLPSEQIADLEKWVRMGAPDPRTDDTVAVVKAKTTIDWNQARQWWSLRPLADPPSPAVQDMSWPANDLDRFVLARIEAAGSSRRRMRTSACSLSRDL